jgi:hypothetical protein
MPLHRGNEIANPPREFHQQAPVVLGTDGFIATNLSFYYYFILAALRSGEKS